MTTLKIKQGGVWTPIAGDISQVAPIPPNVIDWTTPTPWTNVTFQNGWGNYGAPYQSAQYRKVGDIVYIRGLIASGTISLLAFVLPNGFRPTSGGMDFVVRSGQTYGGLFIDADGSVIPSAPGTNAAFWLNVSFASL